MLFKNNKTLNKWHINMYKFPPRIPQNNSNTLHTSVVVWLTLREIISFLNNKLT